MASPYAVLIYRCAAILIPSGGLQLGPNPSWLIS